MNIVPSFRNVSGIYQIRNSVNGKIYVGSAKNIYARWTAHKAQLRENRHHSILLQRAWNKYGAFAFSFEVIEFLDSDRYFDIAPAREIHYIREMRSADRKFGYNIIATERMTNHVAEFNKKRVWTQEQRDRMRQKATGRKQTGRAASGVDNFNGIEYCFISPEGTEYKGKNVAHFAREMGLCTRSMTMLNGGQICGYKGWTTPEIRQPLNKRSFRLMSPDGVIHEGLGVKEFARTHNLSDSSLYNLLANKIESHRGWTNPDAKFVGKRWRHFEIVSPDGVLYQVTGIRRFALKNGLDPAALHRVVQGQKMTHKGWRLPVKTEPVQLTISFT
jgi:group I intron endonuclease